jgi:hypothetical protein
MAMAQIMFAAHGRIEVFLAQRPLEPLQHRIDLTEDAPDQRVRGLAQLFLDQTHVENAQPGAADRFGHVHGVKAQLARLGLQRRQPVGGDAGVFLGLLLERLDLFAHESGRPPRSPSSFLRKCRNP